MLFSRRHKADLSLALVSFIWGATFVVIKSALADASPLVFVLLRFVIASVFLFILFAPRADLRRPGVLRAGTVIAAFLCSGYVFQTIGLKYTTPTKSAFITALSVALVPLLAAAVFRRRPGISSLFGAASAVVGLYFLAVRAGQLEVAGGDLLTLACALAFAAHIVSVGHYAPRYGVGALAILQVGVAALFSAIALPVAGVAGLDALELTFTWRLVLALLVTGALATALAFSIQTWAQRFTTTTHTAILYSLEPVFAALTSYVVGGERLNTRGLLGAGLILAGVLFSELRAGPPPDIPGAPAAANPSKDERV